MSAIVRRTFLAFVLVFVVLTTGAWQNDDVALAKNQAVSPPDIPLYPGLTWSGPAPATQELRINARGDSISLSGERYSAREQFTSDLPEGVLNYYSNEQLAGSGWASYDAFQGSDGTHFVFYHEAGLYLSVDYLKCPRDPDSTCVSVWKSDPGQPTAAAPRIFSTPETVTTTATFGKTSPANGATGLDPTNTKLSWEAYPNADKYKFCVKEGSACSDTDPAWTSTYDRTVTLTSLAYNKTYYWQVKATTCELCVPKVWVYANNDTPWKFSTKTGAQVTIYGNVGIGRAVLSYTDGSLKNVIADSSGAYSIKVPLHWSGTLTPSKSGYIFSPPSASFTDVTATQIIQNFNATAVYVISGNAGLAGVTLSYINGTPKTVVSDANGNYSIPVAGGWSGTVTPSKLGYVFTPASRTYSNISGSQTGQNYTAAVATFTISGNAGVVGVTLKYVSGTPRSVLSDVSGNYSIAVPFGWSGTVTPSKTNYIFSPVNRTYTNVTTNQAAQNYTAIPIYSISGNVGVAGVTLSYTDGTPKTVISQVNGNYSLTVLAGWSGTVTPTHRCFTFNPASRNYNGIAANLTTQNYSPTLKNAAGCADVSVSVGGANQGRFGIPSHGSIRTSFRGVNGGPVKIDSTNAASLFGAERLIYKVNGVATSYSEMMALPTSQVDTRYWLPWYNNVDLQTQLRIANVTGNSATVQLWIGGQEMKTGCVTSPANVPYPYVLGSGQSLRVTCAVNSGPVQIDSTQNIVVSERVLYNVNGLATSFTEMMALPDKQLSTTSWLPWYNSVDLDTQLRIANVASNPATVHLLINGQEKLTGCTPLSSPYTLAAGESIRVTCAGINAGPVEIRSDQNVVASERVIYKVNNLPLSFSEMMALPDGQLNTTFWLPWYNNVDLDTQLRLANVSTSQSATVHLYVNGQEVTSGCAPFNGPFTLAKSESVRISCTGLNNGSVKIQSNIPIAVSERVIYRVNNLPASYSEMMALPNSQLDSVSWLPWYNNVDLDTQLRFGAP